jgi:hypothetical protein
MLKKYLQFIKETISNIETKHHTLGEWIEELCLQNKEILELLRPYLDDSSPSIRIANTINVLENIDKESVYKIVMDYINNTGRKGDVITFVDYTNETLTESLQAGKNVFLTFLRLITSLGHKDTKPSWDKIPDDFLLYFEFKTDYQSAYDKVSRFPSLSMFMDKLPENNPLLYFGVKNNLFFEFGFKEESIEPIPIGLFKLNKSTFKFLQTLNSLSAIHLKRELAYLNIDNLPFIVRIVKHVKEYHPGNTQKRTFKIEDNMLWFGYQGLGNWNNNILENIDEIKQNFQQHLQTLKGHDRLLMAIKTDNNFMTYLVIKIK